MSHPYHLTVFAVGAVLCLLTGCTADDELEIALGAGRNYLWLPLEDTGGGLPAEIELPEGIETVWVLDEDEEWVSSSCGESGSCAAAIRVQSPVCIEMNDEGKLRIPHSLLDRDHLFTFRKGLHYFGFPSTEPIEVAVVFDGFADIIERIHQYPEESGYYWIPGSPYSTLRYLVPGRLYRVKLTESADIHLNDGVLLFSLSLEPGDTFVSIPTDAPGIDLEDIAAIFEPISVSVWRRSEDGTTGEEWIEYTYMHGSPSESTLTPDSEAFDPVKGFRIDMGDRGADHRLVIPPIELIVEHSVTFRPGDNYYGFPFHGALSVERVLGEYAGDGGIVEIEELLPGREIDPPLGYQPLLWRDGAGHYPLQTLSGGKMYRYVVDDSISNSIAVTFARGTITAFEARGIRN